MARLKSKSKRSGASLGTKYGSSVRKRFVSVTTTLKTKRNCPTCSSSSFKRRVSGVWYCPNCGLTISGEAYDVSL